MSSFWKENLRAVRGTLGRFLAIFLIVALGVGFFAGLKATTPDIKSSGDRYFDEQHLMDLRLICTYGFTSEDIGALDAQPGIEGVMPSYNLDALAEIGGEDLVVRFESFPDDGFDNPDENVLNRLVLVEGRLPENPGECLADVGQAEHAAVKVGDRFTLSEENDADTLDSLKTHEFEVVGIVQSPYYITFQRGSSSIGSGEVSFIANLPQSAFSMEYYTQAFVTVADASALSCFSESYDEKIDALTGSLETLGEQRAEERLAEIRSDGEAEIAKAQSELAEKQAEAERELAQAREELANAEAEIVDGEKKIVDSEQEIAQGEQEIAEKREQLKQETALAQEQIDAARTQLSDGLEQLSSAKAQLEAAAQQIAQAKAQSQALREAGQDELADLLDRQIAQYEQTYAEKEAQYRAGEDAYYSGSIQAGEAQEKLDQTVANAQEQIDAAQNELDDARVQLRQARQDLEDGRQELADARAEYEKQEEQVRQQIADAQHEIDDSQAQLDELEAPQWYVLGRDTNLGYADFDQAAERIDAISRVFPVFFFLIAALVCLTTMTRMVEEERTQIGVMKALGYSKAKTASKYLLYAASASILGSIFGLLVSFQIFPKVIWNAYRILYIMPDIETPFHFSIALLSSGAAILCTLMATLAACMNVLRETPASLMRPRAPKMGKRVFLERIGPLWRRLSFTQKVTVRNLIRYKKRFFMTVIGISGCTALMLTGFGLRDSIGDIVELQYGELHQYDATIDLSDPYRESNGVDTIFSDCGISQYLFVSQSTVDVIEGGASKNVNLFVPQQSDRLCDFIVFRTRQTGEPVAFSREGVILTEKLAQQLAVEPGDRIVLRDSEQRQAEVTVTGVVENYVYSYVYMPPELYETSFGQAPEYKKAVAKLEDSMTQTDVAADLLSHSEILSVTFSSTIRDNFSDTIQNLNYVVLVLLVSAMLLAFVVLYNLTNININERIREIATIKVLGFYNGEVSAYVYRENILLTLIGTVVGLILGIFLHQFVIQTAEMEIVMFGRNIKWLSFLFAALLTFLFAALVNLVMYFKLKKIDMVESLKSVE